MGRTPNAATRDRWRWLIEAFESSSLTAADFCRQHDVSTASLYLWRRRFRESAADASDERPSRTGQTRQASALIPVQLNASPPNSSSDEPAVAVLRFCNSVTMELHDTETACEVAARLAGRDVGDRP